MERESPLNGANEQPPLHDDPSEEHWLLDSFVWDPVALVGARCATGFQLSSSQPESLVPPRAAPVVALPAARSSSKKQGYTRRPSVCHVPGCNQALDETPGAPRYCFRFRICLVHLRAEEVQMPEGASRHCQKCCCFHPLSAFRGANRTCAVKLAAQAARRRRQKTEATAEATDEICFDFLDAFLGDSSVDTEPAAVPEALEPLERWSSGAAALPVVREATLKLGGATPGQLPAALAPALASAWCADVALSMEATPRPGCTLLHLDALLPEHAPPAPDAATLARALRASPLRSWLKGRRLDVRCGGSAEPASSAAEMLPRLPRLQPAALLCSASGELHTTLPVQRLPRDVTLCGRLHGQNITHLRFVAASDGSLRLTLPAIGAEGVARLWLAAERGAGGAARAVLLTTDAAIATEVSAALKDEDDADEEQERLICTLGAALRPGCPAQVVAAAAHASLRRGWAATSARLLPALHAALADAGAEEKAAARTLLHAAALSGDVQLVRLTLQHGGVDGVFGAPETADERGITPLHLAAVSGNSTVAHALATATPASSLLWVSARDSAGHTPANLSATIGDAMADVSAQLRRRLNAARNLAVTMAADEEVGPADADVAALASHMLQSYTPTSGSPCARERELFDSHVLASRRHFLLLSPVLSIIIAGHVLLSPAVSGNGGRIDAPSWTTAFDWFGRWAGRGAVGLWRSSKHDPLSFSGLLPLWYVTLAVNAALLAFAGLPVLRKLYQRHGRTAVYVYISFQLLIQRVLVELHFQRVMSGGSARWPTPAAPALLALKVAHMLALPLPVSAVNKLLCVHWILMACAHLAKAVAQPALFARDISLLTLVHVIMVSAARMKDARALAAWRAARRARLAKCKHA